MNSKYDFQDLKARPKGQLPEDVNEDVELIATRLKDENLKKEMILIRENGYYGTLYHRDSDGVVVAYFEFCKGICINFRKVKEVDSRNSFHRNFRNEKIFGSNG